MSNKKTGLERFVEFLDTHLVFNSGDYRMITMNRAKQLLSEEKAVPIHADWQLREELGEYMDDLRNSASNDYADDLETILAKCPAVYFMEDRPSVAKTQEPLACLADRRGEQEVSYYRGFLCSQVMMDGHKEFVVRIGRKGFQGHSYAEAESKARAYLSSLPDQNKGDK